MDMQSAWAGHAISCSDLLPALVVPAHQVSAPAPPHPRPLAAALRLGVPEPALMADRAAHRRATRTDSRGKNGTSCRSCGGATSLKTSRMRCCAKRANSSPVCALICVCSPVCALICVQSRLCCLCSLPSLRPSTRPLSAVLWYRAMLPAPARAAREGRAEGRGRAVVLARGALIRKTQEAGVSRHARVVPVQPASNELFCLK